MTGSSDLTLTESTTLRRVIDLYVESGTPVSSRSIKRYYRLEISTANIRKIMHALEEKGYLFKPHISSGRVPSDRGYRHYVNTIKEHRMLNRRLADEISRRLSQDWTDVKDVLSRTSRLLSDLTHYMGLIMGVMKPRSVIEHLRIMRLEGTGGLVVLKLVSGNERKVYTDLGKEYPAYIIDRAVQIINERIAGYYIEEAVERLETFLKMSGGDEHDIVRSVSREGDFLFGSGLDLSYHFDGENAALEIPELREPKMLQNLVRIMGERNFMIRFLESRMRNELIVTIGRENEFTELEDFSLITKSFETGGCNGLLGVLGPTRMSYAMIFSLLDRMAEELGRIEIRD